MAHEFKDWFDEYELLPESEADLCSWNDEDVAFIKNDVHDGKSMWLIYAADGTKIAATEIGTLPLLWPSRMILLPAAFIKTLL